MLELKPEAFRLADAVAQPLAVCGKPLVADNSGALYWPGQRTLLVADLQLDSAPAAANGAAANGHAPCPRPAPRQVLLRLAEVMDRYEPARVVVLGDSVHARGAVAHPAAEDLEILRILQEDRAWVWVAGSRTAGAVPRQLGGSVCAELEVSGITLRHRPTAGWATHEIAGGMRPAAHLSMYGYTIRRACFVGNGRRLLMPAFGAAGGGTNVLDEAFRPLLGSTGMAVWMLGEEGLYPVATRFLAED
jgi:DNA ligase-associated metallophosphoesterase